MAEIVIVLEGIKIVEANLKSCLTDFIAVIFQLSGGCHHYL
jgi:hypothetical protein